MVGNALVFKPEIFCDSSGPYFGPIMDLHDKYDWVSLRKFFADNVDFLTAFVLAFPKAKVPPNFNSKKNETTIRNALTYTGKPTRLMYNSNAFDPWANWWCGKWSDGVTQYHIWDKTIYYRGYYLQLVTQSTYGFAHDLELERMVQYKDVNMAINVSSQKWGITGWVTKFEDGKQIQMPHMGYLLDEKTLIWITIQRDMKTLSDWNGLWLMFVEWTDTAFDPSNYNIYLNTFRVDSGKISPKPESYTGCCQYHTHAPYDTAIGHCEKYTCVP